LGTLQRHSSSRSLIFLTVIRFRRAGSISNCLIATAIASFSFAATIDQICWVRARNPPAGHQLGSDSGRVGCVSCSFQFGFRDMPLYHFHVAKGHKTVDPRAIELPDAESAKRYAERIADGLSARNTRFGVGSLRDWHVRVTDRNGQPVAQYKVSKMVHAGATPGRSDVQRRLRA
jgi:Domain of unknown function (DUF6894)